MAERKMDAYHKLIPFVIRQKKKKKDRLPAPGAAPQGEK